VLSRRLLTLLLVVPALALGLAACGGDDSSQDEDDITAAIEQAATTDDEANCTEVQTAAFNAQTEFTTEEEGVAACEEAAGDGDVAADSVEVSGVEVDGDSATAEVAFEGGSLGGQTIAVSLVNEDDQWKLDSLDEFVEFDKQAFADGLLEGAAQDDTPQPVLDCVEEAVVSTPDEELQSVYLSGDEQQLVGLFGECFQG
jgi:ABC-type glycerol-3-phosphate transport system substrate-binding protein